MGSAGFSYRGMPPQPDSAATASSTTPLDGRGWSAAARAKQRRRGGAERMRTALGNAGSIRTPRFPQGAAVPTPMDMGSGECLPAAPPHLHGVPAKGDAPYAPSGRAGSSATTEGACVLPSTARRLSYEVRDP